MKLSRRLTFLLVLLFISLILLFLKIIYLRTDYPQLPASISITKTNLKISRASIEWFKNETNRYPASLKELSEYINKEFISNNDTNLLTPGKVFIYGQTCEYISDPIYRDVRGDINEPDSSKESQILDGSGGFYYSSSTGEVKVNVIKPLKEIHPFYFGSSRNEIPSDW